MKSHGSYKLGAVRALFGWCVVFEVAHTVLLSECRVADLAARRAGRLIVPASSTDVRSSAAIGMEIK